MIIIKLKRIELPPWSLDLNPIENIWGEIKENCKWEHQRIKQMWKVIREIYGTILIKNLEEIQLTQWRKGSWLHQIERR